MSLIRLIVIALIIYLVIQIFKRWSANKNAQTTVHQEKTQKMVQCEVCQLHLPENEALKRNNKFFCSQEHLDNKHE